MSLRIVLVETQGALNLGAVARVMKNMGIHRLHLVNPLCSPQDTAARQMAVHAQDILANAQIFTSLPAALTGCQRVLGTCGRLSNGRSSVSPPQGITWLQGVEESALVFGAEDRGLSNTELQYCQGVITIPTVAAYPSLNLAQAVAICCYQWRLSQIDAPPPHPTMPAPLEAIEGLFKHLEQVLLQIGYLYPHTAFARMQKFRKIVHRAELTQEEVTMLRGILSQVQWAVEGGKTHA
ncbi:MAG: RNA methyltransferase [Pseudanabaenaceae cyanobacterium]